MFGSVFYGDRETLAALKPCQILMSLSLLGYAWLWKATFEQTELMMELESAAETNGETQKTIRIFGERWEGKG